MKLVKLVSNPDWVRFSKDLEVEVNNMITAKVNATGGLITIRTSFGDFVTFEDVETDIDYYLNGEELRREGFKELYTKLFKTTTFDNLEDNIYAFCESELKNKNANYIGHLHAKTRLEILKELVADCRSFTNLHGSIIITNHWNINEVLKTFGNDLIIKSLKHNISEDSYKYGVSHAEVTRVIAKLQKKYDS
jgi:deoxyhypusine synthase